MYAVITAFTEGAKELGDMTHANKSGYCALHGYKYFEFGENHPKDMSRGPGWMKLPLIREVMVANPSVRWIFWIDADALFMNYRTRLETLVDEWAFIVVGKDCNGINVGTFFIKNCQRSIDFLDDVWLRGPQPGNWWTTSEQGQIDWVGMMDKYRSGFSVVTNKKFNAYLHDCSPGPMPCAKYETGDFAIHLPGVKDKEAIMPKLLTMVVR